MNGSHLEIGATRVPRVDGNAIVGMLGEALNADMTMAGVRCGECDTEALLAEAVVEMSPTSAIVLCRRCTHTLFTLVRSRDSYSIYFAGLVELTTHP